MPKRPSAARATQLIAQSVRQPNVSESPTEKVNLSEKLQQFTERWRLSNRSSVNPHEMVGRYSLSMDK